MLIFLLLRRPANDRLLLQSYLEQAKALSRLFVQHVTGLAAKIADLRKTVRDFRPATPSRICPVTD